MISENGVIAVGVAAITAISITLALISRTDGLLLTSAAGAIIFLITRQHYRQPPTTSDSK
ncbi:MAG: hypothetical protein AB7D01_06160 [Methanoculleus sp.]